MPAKCDIGLIGLAVMGENLALNLAGKGFHVAVFNRTLDKVTRFLQDKAGALSFSGAYSLREFAALLKKPRKMILMVQAGKAVDDTISQLLPVLEAGDIIIDGGNSHYEDTRRRFHDLRKNDIHFIGLGVSGGEEGALKGPSLMPGGERTAYEQVAPILTAIAAQVQSGVCCSYVGPDGAGHFVKMVHNGIEYADMQLISEAYFMMRRVLGLDPLALGQIFADWNRGVLDSYLISITADILSRLDEKSGKPLIDVILDKAGHKGTGKWTSASALELGVPIPTITEALFARYISAIKAERVFASSLLEGPLGLFPGDKEEFIKAVHDALYASKISSYAQGFALLAAASDEYGWNLDYGKIALLWRGGCIIRARFLENIEEAFRQTPDLRNLMLAPFFREALAKAQDGWRLTIKTGKELGLPTPSFSASLDYYDSYRSPGLPANLIQAQRDYFGAHTFERVDLPGSFHYDWQRREQ